MPVSPLVNINTGMAIGFTTSGFTAELTSINPPEAVRKALDATHLGTSAPGATVIGNSVFIAGDIATLGEIEIEGHLNPSTVPPIDEAAETVTITFKDTTTWVCTGFMTKYTPATGGGVDEKMTFSASIQPSGGITVTAAT